MLMKLSELKKKLRKDKQYPKCYTSKLIIELPEDKIIDMRTLVMNF